MKFRIELTAVVDVEYDPLKYGQGVAPDVASSLEIDRASRDPCELLRGWEIRCSGAWVDHRRRPVLGGNRCSVPTGRASTRPFAICSGKIGACAPASRVGHRTRRDHIR
jgi:hypothetical protein